MARRAVEYIEIDVEWCDLVFGTHPCRASLSGVFTPSGTISYDFGDGSSSVKGWTTEQGSGGPATLTGGAAYATFNQSNASDPRVVGPAAAFSGADLDKCRLNVRRVGAGGGFDGTVYAFTASGFFAKTFSNPVDGVDTTIVVDMSTATPGGGESGSWSAKTFTHFRVDFDHVGGGASFRLYSIEMGTLQTGNDRCFNTRATCQDVPRYDPSPVTLRFAKDNGALSKNSAEYALANIKNIEFTPATVAIAEDIGIRATLKVTMQDRPHSDTGPGFDKYHALRSYNPFNLGTLFGKLRARQPYLENTVVRYIRGYSDQALADMETRTFVVTKAEVSGASGEFLLEAQDALRLTTRSKSQVPVPNNGYLNVDITDTAQSLLLAPSGIAGVEYPLSGYVAIGGNEIVLASRDQYARLTAASELLLYFDGADTSTTMTDSSGKGRNGTASGDAQIDTEDFKYGGSALLLDGTGDFVVVSDNSAWTFGADATVECWLKVTDLSTARTIIAHGSNLNNEWRLFVTAAGRLAFFHTLSSVTGIDLQTAAGVITTDTWHHVALVKQGTTYRLFVDGVLQLTDTNATAISNFSGNLRIGIRSDAAAQPFVGWIDTLHITSSALWTANFDLPGPPLASTDELRLLRGQLGTTPKAHAGQERVQVIFYKAGVDPAEAIYDILVNYCDVPPSWVPLDSMKLETANYLQVNLTGIVSEPTAADKVLSEICKHFALTIWWDDLNELIRLRVMRGITSQATFDDDNTVNGTLSIEEQPDKRVTQVWYYYGKIDPTESDDNPENFRSVAVTVDPETESLYGSPSIMKVYSRWVPLGGRSIAQRISEIMLGRFSDPPRRFTFEVMRREENPSLIALGSGISVESWSLQKPNGMPETVDAMVVRYDPDVSRQRVEAEEYVFETSTEYSDRAIVIETDAYNLNIRTLFDNLYPAPDASTIVDFVVESGVKVGSANVLTPSLTVGSWPVGATVNVIIHGRVQGKGGLGGGGSLNGAAKNGEPGGTALYTRFPINLSGTGQIYGGGGGGGGGGKGSGVNGGGGGGGAGFTPGLGGPGAGSATAGTTEARGLGGNANNSLGAGDGGNGGNPGQAGTAGQPGSTQGNGNGGAAGIAIDGNSYITETGSLTVVTNRVN